jgi:Flp pilus assembly protein TadD
MQPRTIHRSRKLFYPPLCAAFLAAGAGGPPAIGEVPVLVNAPAFDIEYKVNEAALPLESVRLWYTADGGATWIEYGRDEDRISPMRFRAPGEGVYGFYFVLANATGPSSPPPRPGTPPQQQALVDYTPPLVQLHQVRAVSGVDETLVQIRWTAVDAHFGPRPIEIFYGPSPDQAGHRIGAEGFANTGSYDWRVSESVTGAVAVKVAATDRAGLRTESESLFVEIAPPQPVETTRAVDVAVASDDSALPGTSRAREKAALLFSQGLEEARAGHLTGGVFRLREAVKLDPHNVQAFAEMGRLLYSLGDLERAKGAYDIALKQQANHRDALRGMARVLERMNDMPGAAEKLRMLLRHHPTDAEVWLQLGDVSVHQGDEVRARECYVRAAQTDPKEIQVIAEAQQRLTLMADLSRNATRKASEQISQSATD